MKKVIGIMAIMMFLSISLVGVPKTSAETEYDADPCAASYPPPCDDSVGQGYRPPPPPPGSGPVMRALDIDRDGALSKDEIASAAENLMMLDKDGDGVISHAELRPCPPPFEGR